MSYSFNYLPTMINCEEMKTFNYILYKKHGNGVYACVCVCITDTRAPAERFHGKCLICFKQSLVISEDKTSQ